MIGPYDLPHACETAEIAALLGELTPRQRRVLRAYVWKVELGELTVTEWLRSDGCPVSERSWYASGEKANYLHSQAFQAALEKYRSAGQKWQINEESKSIGRARSTLVRAAPKAAERIVEAAQADMSALFKTSERWVADPLPGYEIVDQRQVEDSEGKRHWEYLVRAAVLDIEKLQDTRYARLIKKFSSSAKTGLSIELYDAQRAAEAILDRADKDTANKAPASVQVEAELGDATLQALDQALMVALYGESRRDAAGLAEPESAGVDRTEPA